MRRPSVLTLTLPEGTAESYHELSALDLFGRRSFSNISVPYRLFVANLGASYSEYTTKSR